MAYYSRYGRRYGRYRKYRRFYKRYRRSYARKYVNSSSRSSVRMKTTVVANNTMAAGHSASGTGAVVGSISCLTGTADISSAANSPLYRTYCNLYEECKVIGMKISLAVTTAVGGSDVPSLQIYTAWDRKHGSGEAAYNVNDIKNAATSNVATALNNNVAKLTRSVYASDLIEKATWFDATLDTTNNHRNLAWHAAGLNPNMFCPTFFFFFNSPSLGATVNINYSVSVTYYFAFRNPRFGGSGESKMIELGPRSVYPDGHGDMDGDDGDMVEHEDLDAASPPDMVDDEPAGAAEAAAAPSKRSSAAVVVSPAKKSRSSLNK